jgi:exonuclease V
MTCKSPQISAGTGFDDNSSDYGSDFTPDEEDLLNELLAKAAATQADAVVDTAQNASREHFHRPATTTTTTTAVGELVVEEEEELQNFQQAALVIADIEDYEDPRAARVPKVLGREKWSPRKARQVMWSWRSGVRGSGQEQGNVGAAGGMFVIFSVSFENVFLLWRRCWVEGSADGLT